MLVAILALRDIHSVTVGFIQQGTIRQVPEVTAKDAIAKGYAIYEGDENNDGEQSGEPRGAENVLGVSQPTRPSRSKSSKRS
jgi:hypothetical protein